VLKTFVALAIAAVVAAPAAATDKRDVMAVVHQWVANINAGDSNMLLATCADETSIIDDIPPHEWHGAGACAKWKNDFDAFLKKNAVTDMTASALKPRHADITADRAYVVVPINLSFKQAGKDVKDVGSTFTLALQKGASGWRITGWAWAAH
jgi:ketosteroid isomerase-like protein